MKRLALKFYRIQEGKKTRITRWRMSEDDAAKQFPGATPVEHDAMWIDMAETPEEQHAMNLANSTSAFLRNKD